MKDTLRQSFNLLLFYLFSIVYLEVLFKIRVLNFQFDSDLFRIVIFSLFYSFLFLFILKFFGEKTVKTVTYVLVVLITFLYFNQEIYSSFVEGFYSITVIGDFTAGLSFFSDYLESIRLGHIAYLLPIASLIALDYFKLKFFHIEYCGLKQPLYFLLLSFLFYFGALQTVSDESIIRNQDGEIITIENVGTLLSYSDLDLYTYMYNSQDALKKFGLLTYTQRDFMQLFRNDPISPQAYEVLIEDFINNQPGHIVNAHSNIFDDKNFILIMAESLDTFAINETLTPTLYRLKTEYAYFENYYSPLYYRSTADSEFLVQTSMYPDKNVTLSMDAYMENTFPNTLPKLFKEQGYTTYSFHNYFDYFYPRGDFHLQTLGYDQFWGSEELGITTGFDPDRVIVDHIWQSDYDMMKRIVPKFINDDKFFVNILTVSGHFNYAETHEIARPDYVEAVQEYLDNLEEPVEYSDQILYYLAVHMEVDRAVQYLIDELENANKLDDTVIMIFGDHYAYGIDNEDIWAYDDEYKTDNDELELHNVPLMIMSNSTQMRGIKTAYASTIDITPTVSNLFGLNLNYKQVFGNDIFAINEHIVRFADGSFISSDFRYDALSENYIINDETISEQYIYQINQNLMNNYMYNLLMLEYDYFKEDTEE
ncbi:LTA synthase family protein [Candidatus Xianfuyuplasma coldseepsis]|uniref:LTA synthase family protein n=1 Tax=Candidatus Xianfuyuplasma coldseepsis TaxID=2782163 RepID=A0A7L7KPQ1_9MOLU|nr:LTA synthase family protein [Xianfuyuplasma coldseepsis]QMS84771.1 LTA synthase family protein [Xianfuyuplasma coldseepsis]